MNQIYRPKRKVLVSNFAIFVCLAVFWIIVSSCYIYASYNKSNNEEQIVSFYNEEIQDEQEEIPEIIIEEEPTPDIYETLTNSGLYTMAYLKIPKINLELPILSETSAELLDQGLNKYWGSNPNRIGNFCVVGHNYAGLFKELPKMEIGDTFELTDLEKKTVTYIIYDKYIVKPEDTSCTSQLTGGKKEVTLITCVVGGKERLILKATEV